MILQMSPTPIGVYENFNYDEHDFFENQIPYEPKTEWGERSKDKYILKSSNLQSWIQDQINDYSINCLATKQKLKITQSWCIRNKNQSAKLFRHIHPNSIVSGAYYINCSEVSSCLRIEPQSCLNSDRRILWEYDDNLFQDQPWLWQYYEFFPKIGRLYIFPSNLYHYIESKSNIDNRCVISFNTWFSSPIGSIENLNYLE